MQLIKTKGNPSDVYGSKSGVYAEFAAKSFSWKYIEAPTAEKYLRSVINLETKIIDAGCGQGRSMELWVCLGAKKENLVGIDLSLELLKLAADKFPESELINASVSERIEDLENEKADVVVSTMVIDYLSNTEFESFLNNSLKWLKRGGKLFFILPHPIRDIYDNLPEYFKRRRRESLTPWGELVPYYQRTVGDYVNLTIKTGFNVLAVDEPEVPIEAK